MAKVASEKPCASAQVVLPSVGGRLHLFWENDPFGGCLRSGMISPAALFIRKYLLGVHRGLKPLRLIWSCPQDKETAPRSIACSVSLQ